jgi:hypothetical protein
MRNQWLPRRIADYVPVAQVKKLKADNVPIERDFTFGVARTLVEAEAPKQEVEEKHYVRPVEIQFLSVRASACGIHDTTDLNSL